MALGEDYPFFVKDHTQFLELLGAETWVDTPPETASAVAHAHSLSRITEEVGRELLRAPAATEARRVLFAGHDLKFIDAFASSLKAAGWPVYHDLWEWGRCRDEQLSRELSAQADVVFCEWGLANAAWYSRELPAGKRLVVRIHAQEVRERARRFGAAIDHARVDRFIFVSEEVRAKALELWSWPAEKTIVIPNYVNEHEFTFDGRDKPRSVLTLGILGIVPSLKRFDRAVDLLEALVKRGVEAVLKVKGHRPETLDFMLVPDRADEMEGYYSLYRRLEADESLRGRVTFEPWGGDVAGWYGRIDVILSCSDTESFHYALADGVLSGCYPVVWPWNGASRIYDPGWVIEGLEAAVARIEQYVALPDSQRIAIAHSNRDLVISRYGSARIFPQLADLLRDRV
jgi:glycosyltransferase involved in cell wall biosynthesis